MLQGMPSADPRHALPQLLRNQPAITPPQRVAFSGAFVLLASLEIAKVSPLTALWAAPAILLSAILIAWAAESAQFFVSQGIALAMLAWLQTMPEFAVEAVLAWKQQTPLLMANLTGALRLLTGLAWPMIYATAAFFYRRKHGRAMKAIYLHTEHCVEVVGLILPLIYMLWIWLKGTLTVWDAVVLILIYCAYLFVLTRFPPMGAEGIEDLDRVPRYIVKSSPKVRNLLILLLFAGGGGLIYCSAEPFLGSLLAVSAILGIPSFVFVQWVAPFVSEFPEKVSAFYWARTIDRAPMALMNMISSNINQWTLLVAMLPIIFSISSGHLVPIRFDAQQELELLMTIGQSLIGMMFLMNMEFAWWEATVLFGLWFSQFALSPVHPGPGWFAHLAGNIHWLVTCAYFIWFGIEVIRTFASARKPLAFVLFARLWRQRVLGRQAR
jgi:cation:H+ antiporter